jgi:hypothetical protein
MRGLDPRIYLLRKKPFLQRRMDCRVKPGNDAGWAALAAISAGR